MDSGLSPQERDDIFSEVVANSADTFARQDQEGSTREISDSVDSGIIAAQGANTAQRLSASEKKELFNAFLNAFPSVSALEQAVYYQLDLRLDYIVARSSPMYDQVFQVIQWAEANGKLGDLLQGAIAINPSNQALQSFYKRFAANAQADEQSEGRLTTSSSPAVGPITPQLRRSLVQTLKQVPRMGEFSRRTLLLVGIPAAASLARDARDPERDLGLIVDQLSNIGRLKSGQWPLLLLVDNAIAYTEDPSVKKRLSEIDKKLSKMYHENPPAGLAR